MCAVAGDWRWRRCVLTLVVCCVCAAAWSAAAGDDSNILARLGVTRGLCVVLGDATGDLAVDLARQSELLIYVQLTRDEDVTAVRRTVGRCRLLRHAHLCRAR